MLSCKEITAKVSASLDYKPPLQERLAVKFHMAMCTACRRMARQMRVLRVASRRLAAEGSRDGLEIKALSHEAKQRILQKLIKK